MMWRSWRKEKHDYWPATAVSYNTGKSRCAHPSNFHHLEERKCSTRSGLNSRSCCHDKSHQSRGVQGQSDPPRNRRFFYFTLEMVSQTTVLSRGAKSRLASSKLNQVWLKSQDVMSGQDLCGGYYVIESLSGLGLFIGFFLKTHLPLIGFILGGVFITS